MLTDSNSISDWFYIVPAATFIDFIVVVLVKYAGKDPFFKVKSLNDWYSKFGIFAVLSDITSLLIGIGASRFIYTFLKQNNILSFFLILFVFQLFHDIFFYLAVIRPLPKGENEMIDVFKEYAEENGAKILGADYLMLFFSICLASYMSSLNKNYTISGFILTIYAFCYIVFTR